MATEQYSIGYEEGHQAGWNAAMESLPAQRKPLTPAEIDQIEARWDASMHGSKIAFVVHETEAAHGIKENT